jgi:hypothetical protein
MTGTDGGRPEVVLEGSADGGRTWREYVFFYKPGCGGRTRPRRASRAGNS